MNGRYFIGKEEKEGEEEKMDSYPEKKELGQRLWKMADPWVLCLQLFFFVWGGAQRPFPPNWNLP